ncbi:sigma-70 family RNA polymerase sigma factor [Nannocystis sp. RBIL2]|uniref:RNA polymerase sigma factor n=1 Tax=Nannocystis sp. RBIL2 TaxID=2996788 RepID=UPI002271A5DC|nr:sigma-70 family RNA polymerase sigma factor [Nannocystis sp. RBIL2]MCY1069225.1 sigma-70 family RNA polymerase sigma factor [Nannocystis sp. RBIL2]
MASFGRLYRASHGLVRSVIARLGVPAAAVDDAVQDVFVVLYRRRAEFDAARAAEPWLVGIARRVAFRYRRAHGRRQRKLAAWCEVAVGAVEERPWMRVEAERFLRRFFDQLGADRREVFVLGELHGLTGPEIAARLGVPLDTVYTRLRATRSLFERALLADAAREPAPDPAVTQRAWLVLLPRLGEPAGASGWLVAGLVKAKGSIGVLVVAAAVALPVVLRSPAEAPDAAPAGASGPTASRVASSANTSAPIVLPPPPPGSRFEAMLSQRMDAPDELGAGLLATAVAALQAGDATTALAELDRHERSFSQSPLAEARSLTRVRALCELGRADEARAVAAGMSEPARQRVRAQLDSTCVGR